MEDKLTLLVDHQFILHTIFLPFSSCDILLLLANFHLTDKRKQKCPCSLSINSETIKMCRTNIWGMKQINFTLSFKMFK